jgi:hypothetical protein
VTVQQNGLLQVLATVNLSMTYPPPLSFQLGIALAAADIPLRPTFPLRCPRWLAQLQGNQCRHQKTKSVQAADRHSVVGVSKGLGHGGARNTSQSCPAKCTCTYVANNLPLTYPSIEVPLPWRRFRTRSKRVFSKME